MSSIVSADLQHALTAAMPYPLLSAALKNQISQTEYHQQLTRHCVSHNLGFDQLPMFLRREMDEKKYYAQMISTCQEQLKLYPYEHIENVVDYTRETPLTYYIAMVADLLRNERSYDTLPNFTALDILNKLGIGRNQYLHITREVRSKLMWHVHRSFVTDHLPSEMLSSVEVGPFWEVHAVEASVETLKKYTAASSSSSSQVKSTGAHGGNGSIITIANNNPSKPSQASSIKEMTDADLAVYFLILTRGGSASQAAGRMKKFFSEKESVPTALTRLGIHHAVFTASEDSDGEEEGEGEGGEGEVVETGVSPKKSIGIGSSANRNNNNRSVAISNNSISNNNSSNAGGGGGETPSLRDAAQHFSSGKQNKKTFNQDEGTTTTTTTTTDKENTEDKEDEDGKDDIYLQPSLSFTTTANSRVAALLPGSQPSSGSPTVVEQRMTVSSPLSKMVPAKLYACEFPWESIHRLYRKGLLYTTFSVDPMMCVSVPPLENFVMNRSSNDPYEVFLYRLMSTVDERTSLSLLSQLLVVTEEEVCRAAEQLIILGLAYCTRPRLPVLFANRDTQALRHQRLIHQSWRAQVELLRTLGGVPKPFGGSTTRTARINNTAADETEDSLQQQQQPHLQPQQQQQPGSPGVRSPLSAAGSSSTSASGSAFMNPSSSTAASHPVRRVALLYDASLTGLLMMTNLSSNPAFKQCAVTLFEVGKLSDEMVSAFVDQLEEVNPELSSSLGGDAERYVNSVLCLREVLKGLRALAPNETDVARISASNRSGNGNGDGEDGGNASITRPKVAVAAFCGVDMLKVESLNELAATTRYSVLARNYWAYFVVSPVSYAPLIDIALNNVYGSTINVMPSPWLTLFLYTKMKHGPPCVFLPFGSCLHEWPPLLQEEEEVAATADCMTRRELRLQPLTLDAEITYSSPSLSLMLVAEMTSKAPLFAQVARHIPLKKKPDGFFSESSPDHECLELFIPFVATDEEIHALVVSQLNQHIQGRHATAMTSSTSTALPGDCFAGSTVEVVTDPTPSPAAGDMGIIALVRRAVDTLGLSHSVGYFVVTTTVERRTLHRMPAAPPMPADAPLDAPPPEEPASIGPVTYTCRMATIVDIGLGIPLSHYGCCQVILKHLSSLLVEDVKNDAHNMAMKAIEEQFGTFLEQYSNLAHSVREKATLLTQEATGPATQQHIRKLAAEGNCGAPFPSSLLLFNGTELTPYDELDSLCELW